MKQLFYFLIIAVCLTACGSEDIPNKKNSSSNKDVFGGLKLINFEKQADKVISEEKTSQRISDGNGGFKYLYKTKVSKSYSIYPMNNPLKSNNDIIYPGSILRGGSFLEGSYNPITYEESFNPVTISINLKGKLKIDSKVEPTLSGLRNFFNEKLSLDTNAIDYTSSTGIFEFESFKITSSEEFKRSLNFYSTNDNILNLINKKFEYKEESKKSRILVKFAQTLFNASMDAQHHSKWLKNGFKKDAFNEVEPLYISSVDYGRMGYILIESSENKNSEAKEMVNNAILFHLFKYKKDKFKKDHSKLNSAFEKGQIKIYVNGGSSAAHSQISDIKSFFDFIKLPKPKELVNTAVPISFKVRKVSDNTEVKVFDSYTEMTELYK